MDFETLKAKTEEYLLDTYRRCDVALDHGAGAVLYDPEGREYLDFAGGLGVNALGHGSEVWVNAIVEQAVKLGHSSNLYYTEPPAKLAELLCRRGGLSGACFVNSGAEANEGMLRLARAYSFQKYGKGRGTVLTLQNARHGRTAATAAASGGAELTDGYRRAEPTIEGVEAVAGHDVCAVLIELVPGDLFPLPRDFVHDLAVLCAERDWLLLLDEVATGVGRTGTLFAYQQYGVLPDAVSFAGGVAGGLPLGGFLVNDKCRRVLGPGSYGSTFGGNPICASAALAVLNTLDDTALQRVTEKGRYLRGAIEAMDDVSCLGRTRGLGLMVGVEVRGERTGEELMDLLAREGLLVLTAGNDLRLLPPLTVTHAELDKGLAILRRTLAD